jgi:aspartate carbamoyltransferase regulatory subunit
MQVNEQSLKRDKFENKSTFIDHIEDEMSLMLFFILNFKHYMLKARQGLRVILESTKADSGK